MYGFGYLVSQLQTPKGTQEAGKFIANLLLAEEALALFSSCAGKLSFFNQVQFSIDGFLVVDSVGFQHPKSPAASFD